MRAPAAVRSLLRAERRSAPLPGSLLASTVFTLAHFDRRCPRISCSFVPVRSEFVTCKFKIGFAL